MTLEDIISLVKSQGYEIDTRPYKLNVVGVRDTAITEPILFQDEIAYFYYDEYGNLVGGVGRGTTSPSVYFLENPMNSVSAGILKNGQYKDAYSIGLHRNKYQALVQVKPVTVMRDSDRNSYLDFFAPTQTGLFGINIHHGSNAGASIDKRVSWSKQLTKTEAQKYTISNILGGTDKWSPLDK